MIKLHGIKLSQEANNDEQSTGFDVSSASGTELTLDQLYLGTISSRHPDTVDTDLYKINVIAGQTYIFGYSFDGNVVGWNAQSYDSTNIDNNDFYLKFSLSHADGTVVTTTHEQSFNYGSLYSFTANTTGILSLLVEPSSTSAYQTYQQDYGFFVKAADTGGMESMLRGPIIGSVFSDDVTLSITELDALDSYIYQIHLLSGNDQVLADFQNSYWWGTVYLDEGNDTISVTNEQRLDRYNVLTDSFNALTAYGGEGDDVINGGRGSDNLIGGSGNDTINGGDGNDTLKGDCYNGDLYYCTPEYDYYGGVGETDTINGGAGKDIIVGGIGADLLTGGSDTDLFVYEVKEDFGDTITDFEIGIDKIALFDALETSNLAGKTFSDIVNLVQNGNDTLVQMSLDATAGSWVTVTTLQNTQASNLTAESFHSFDKIGTLLDQAITIGHIDSSNTRTVFEDQSLVFVSSETEHTIVSMSSGSLGTLSKDLNFTHVEFSNSSYEHGISISDVVLQLRDIVGLSTLEGTQKIAADIDGNGEVTISDVVSNLRHIVGLDTIEKCALVNSADELVTSLTNSTIADLTLVQYGDVDLSATFFIA